MNYSLCISDTAIQSWSLPEDSFSGWLLSHESNALMCIKYKMI